MFKEPADLKKPKMCNGKEWWWCSTKNVGKFHPGEYCRHLPKKYTGSAKKGGGYGSIQSGRNNFNLEKLMASVIYHNDNSEEHNNYEES